MNPRRLYRSRRDRQLAGVAAGMAEYLEVDPTLVRILWILSAFLGGFTILLYIILAFVIPLDPRVMPTPGPWQAAGPAWGVPPAQAAGGESAGEPGAGEAGAPASSPDGVAAPTWWVPTPADQPIEHHDGRGGLYVGVLLVVFGAIALANTLIPGWGVGVAVVPAFIIALGVALLVGAARRPASQS